MSLLLMDKMAKYEQIVDKIFDCQYNIKMYDLVLYRKEVFH